MSSAAPALPAAPSPWLLGRWTDVLLGYGLAYLLSVPLFFAIAQLGWAGAPWLTIALALVFSTPHYGATLLRVYERREDRRRYVVFALWATLALSALFVASLYHVVVGSLLLTAYLTWGPWHFSGQNYGLVLMALRRRGVPVDAGLKRLVYLTFVLSAGLAILALHMRAGSYSFSGQSYDASGTFGLLSLGIPRAVALPLVAGGVGAWLVCVGWAATRLVRSAPLRALAPAGLLLSMQALWYLPALTIGLFESAAGGFAFTAIWVATAHAVQYLWVTYYYARREGRTPSLARFYGRTWLAGGLLLLPIVVFAPGIAGGWVANGAGVVVLGVSVLNLHHFILDGAIWKLRDGRVARVLLRDQPVAPDPIGPARRGWLRPAGAALLALGAIPLALQAWEARLLWDISRKPAEATRISSAAADLAWLGRAPKGVWGKLGAEYERAGEPARALEAYRRELARDERPAPWIASRAAWLLIDRSEREPEALAEAERLARYLVRSLGSTKPDGLQTLATVHARAGRWQRALATAQAALRVARAQGDEPRVRVIEAEVARYRSALERS